MNRERGRRKERREGRRERKKDRKKEKFWTQQIGYISETKYFAI